MDDYSTTSFMLAFIRFSCNVGYPKILLPDEGSQLREHIIQNKLYIEYGVEYDTCPVGAHYMHGKVERKIKSIEESIRHYRTRDRLLLNGKPLGMKLQTV